jgi:hypothetical protein
MPGQYNFAFTPIEPGHPPTPRGGNAIRSGGEAMLVAGNRVHRPTAGALHPTSTQRQEWCTGVASAPTAQSNARYLRATQARWRDRLKASGADSEYRSLGRIEADLAVVWRGATGENASECQDRSRRHDSAQRGCRS